MMRPPGPVPESWERDSPAAEAVILASGDARTFPSESEGAEVGCCVGFSASEVDADEEGSGDEGGEGGSSVGVSPEGLGDDDSGALLSSAASGS